MIKNLDYILKRGVAEIIVEDEFRKLLESGKPLRLKQGFDPSRADIHLGHVVGLRKLRQLQELGHKVVLIVGDWTAMIGDPSGASSTRQMLTYEEVKRNAETYLVQFFKVVDRDKTEVRWQSEWYGNFSLADVLKLTSKFTIAQFLARDDFNRRFNSGRPIALVELMYPLLQAYDSVYIKADVEFGGTDQKFNCLVGRELQQIEGQNPQQVFLVPLLVGIDGKNKMSKSLGNYIGVDDPPNNMYGKVMSLPDDLIMDYFELVTDVPDKELSVFRKQLATNSINPMQLKKRLAFEIVKDFYNVTSANDAENYFTNIFQKKVVPDKLEDAVLSFDFARNMATKVDQQKLSVSTQYLPALLQKMSLVPSKTEAKRLISQGAVAVDGETVTKNDVILQNGTIIRVGKKIIRKIVFIY